MTSNDSPPDDQPIEQQPADEINEVLQTQSSTEAAEAKPDQPDEKPASDLEELNQLAADLYSEDEGVRSKALIALLLVEASNIQVLRALEHVAANDKNPDLRESALGALRSPVHQNERFHSQYINIHTRRWLQQEINQWETDQLVSDQQAAILRAHYPVSVTPSTVDAAVSKHEKERSLKEMLLSETSIRIALYLGAFFVIVAAFIFGVAFEQARIPILAAVVVMTYTAALAFFKRLPQASFVFYAIGTSLIPITGLVLIDQVSALEPASDPFWTGVFTLLASVWVGGTFWYRSRLFSVLALLSGTASAYILATWLSDSLSMIPLLLTLPTYLGLGGATLLRRWQEGKFFQPLFIVSLLLELALLLASAGFLIVTLLSGETIEQVWWFVTAITWLLGSAFFVLSQLFYAFRLFPLMAVTALVPVPLFTVGAFEPDLRAFSITAWAEGLLFALGGGWAAQVKQTKLREYSLWLVIAGIILFALASILGLSDSIELCTIMLSGIALLYLGLTIWQRGSLTWIVALTAALLAYLSTFSLDDVHRLGIGYEFIFLVPAIVYLGGELLARRLKDVGIKWYLPARILGLLAAGCSIVFTFVRGFEEPWNSVIIFALLAGFALLYALLDGRTPIGALGTASLAVCIPYLVMGLEWDHWLGLVYGLALFYWFLGALLSLFRKDENWSRLLRISGLALGTIGAFTAPFEGGALAVLGTTVIASLFVVEALRLGNVWLGIPANLLYLGAYFMALIELDVTEPQFYSIVAGLLGVGMQYLLLRSKQYAAAVITGVIAQLILLSTTYVQMVSSEKFTFFILLFVQSLLLLVYGILVRARSFVITPIAFVVIGVITVAFNILSEIGQLLLIGCTGITLLALGVLALLLRERIANATAGFGERLGVWRW